MNQLSEIAVESPACVAQVDAPSGLSAILQPEHAGVIWPQEIPPTVQTWLDDVDPEVLPRARVVLRPHSVPALLEEHFQASGLPSGPEQDWLREDIASLSAHFADAVDAPYLRLRLDVVTTNACRRFHVDTITARLVCTYRGPGTQFGISHVDAAPAPVFLVPTGAPMVLRGRLWPTEPPSGLLHRSPPIEGTGVTRLVLVLDPVAELGEAL